MSWVNLIFAGVLGLAGCGDGRPETAEVRGAVSFRGEPLESGTIIFSVPGNRQTSGKIVAGKITEVTTFESGDGAPLGTAQIAVFASAHWEPPQKPAGDTSVATPPMVLPSLIPERYNDPATSGLRHEIKSGVNDVVIELTP